MTTPETYPWRLQLPIYATGFFNGNVYLLTGILMPLWAVIVFGQDKGFLVGLVVASRQCLPVLLSIHGGALMDRFGPRRIMLIFGAIGIASMAAFPSFPLLSMMIALQMLSGLAESLGWVGSQTLVGKLMKGHTVYTGRLSFSLRVGGFLGPWLAGIAWHQYGPEAGFYFMALWVACGWLAGWFVPEAEPEEPATQSEKTSLWTVLPRWSDYAATFRMLAIPAVLLIAVVTLVRQTGSGIQLSFYPVWLNQIGITAAEIGFMLGCSHVVAASSSLTIGWVTRWISPPWLLVITIGLSVVIMAGTPLFGNDFVSLPVVGKIYFILFGVICLRGLTQGWNMPLMMSIGMQAVSAGERGKVVALRITTNRIASGLIPLFMGAMWELLGPEESFYIVGVIGLTGLALTVLWMVRSNAFKS
ncbi:MAG: hypothetical protein CMM52_04310 [Rhodospirillaceae bacterium]|nr:hypothetical protein [Rhodospirillaceae bacterium]|tara:strand:- start:59105 stop:60352 length:1248 start_codon:yes stop_codon:yes gene_type:complete